MSAEEKQLKPGPSWQGDLFRQTRSEAWAETQSGIDQALDHADREIPNWSEQALSMLRQYVAAHSQPFVCDQLREWCEIHGLEAAPTRFAWGGVMLQAKNRGLVRKTRQVNYHFPGTRKTHTKLVQEWVSANRARTPNAIPPN